MNFLYSNFIAVLWVTAITTFLLGVFVWLRRRHNLINRTFALYCLSISWWSFCEIWGISADAKETALLWTRIEQVGVFFIPTFFVHFIISLLNIKDKKWLTKSAYCFSAITALFCFTPYMIADSVPMSSAPYVKRFGTPGPVYHFAIIFFVALIIFGLRELYIAYRASSSSRRNQLKYLFFSTLFGYIGGGANFLLVYNISIPILNPFGTYALPIYIAVVTYAIVKYRLMDIRIAAIRTVFFAIIYVPVLLTPFLVGLLMRNVLEKLLGQSWWMVPVLGSSILAPLGLYVYMVIKTRAEDILLREQRQYQRTLLGISRSMTLEKDLGLVLQMIVRTVSDSLNLKAVHLFLADKDSGRFVLKASCPDSLLSEDIYFEPEDPLIKKFISRKSSILREEDDIHYGKDTKADFGLADLESKSGMKVSLAIPSFVQNNLIAFLLLGEKPRSQMYTQDDLNVFEVLANQAALAIENAIFYEETGKTLAEKLQEQRIWSIGKMGAGIGHQINNRFGALSANAELALLTYLPKLKNIALDPDSKELIAKIEDALQRVADNAKRGGEIAKTLTNFSRKSDEFKPVDIEDALNGALNLLSCKFKTEELNLELDLPAVKPKIYGNLSMLQDIFFNMLDNTHDAEVRKQNEIKEGILTSVSPYVPKTVIKARPNNSHWDIEIQDNGIGMTEDETKKLFIPFFTTKATSEKGTGLGISMMKLMIDAHKGSIKITSKFGEGTRIMLTIPIMKG